MADMVSIKLQAVGYIGGSAVGFNELDVRLPLDLPGPHLLNSIVQDTLDIFSSYSTSLVLENATTGAELLTSQVRDNRTLRSVGVKDGYTLRLHSLAG
jgi:hypothetical protein